MALNITMLADGKTLCVEEIIYSFMDTKRTYWYYCTEKWLRSRLGKKDEVPTQKMMDNEIEWVKKYHLPRINK